ncbi:MAG: hypothetical protein WD200_04105 [Candidatus Andersenbacteria bacterium]
MADVQTNSTIAWLALLVAVVALIFGVVAFNRSGRDVPVVVEEQAQETSEDIELNAARIRAETQLAALRARVAAGEGYEEVREEALEVRSDLEVAYANASVEARQQWQEIEPELEQLEAQLREESADALTALDSVLDRLRADVARDEE